MKKFLFISLCFCCACCGKRENTALETEGTNNRNFKVELLFEHDGYKVYRFNDGNDHYYVTPVGAVSETHSKMEGKIRKYYTEEVQTVNR